MLILILAGCDGNDTRINQYYRYINDTEFDISVNTFNIEKALFLDSIIFEPGDIRTYVGTPQIDSDFYSAFLGNEEVDSVIVNIEDSLIFYFESSYKLLIKIVVM